MIKLTLTLSQAGWLGLYDQAESALASVVAYYEEGKDDWIDAEQAKEVEAQISALTKLVKELTI